MTAIPTCHIHARPSHGRVDVFVWMADVRLEVVLDKAQALALSAELRMAVNAPDVARQAAKDDEVKR